MVTRSLRERITRNLLRESWTDWICWKASVLSSCRRREEGYEPLPATVRLAAGSGAALAADSKEADWLQPTFCCAEIAAAIVCAWLVVGMRCGAITILRCCCGACSL